LSKNDSIVPNAEHMTKVANTAGLAAARARGHAGGRPYTMTPAKVRLAMAAMGKPETNVAALCAELGISRQTLYRHVSPEGTLRPDGEKLLARKR
jgi:DNA-binding phage protein